MGAPVRGRWKPSFQEWEHLAREFPHETRRVEGIAQQGVAEVLQMHANLVGAPGVQHAFHERAVLPASSASTR